MSLHVAACLLALVLLCGCAVEGDVVVATVGSDSTEVIVGKNITTVCRERTVGSVRGS